MDDFAIFDPGLKKDLVKIFSQAVGRENAVNKVELLRMLGTWNDQDPNFERRVRAAIVDLRNEGYLIISTAADGGGYWLAGSWEELLEFTEREYNAKAMTMLNTEKVMKAAAQEKWGPIQVRMF